VCETVHSTDLGGSNHPNSDINRAGQAKKVFDPPPVIDRLSPRHLDQQSKGNTLHERIVSALLATRGRALKAWSSRSFSAFSLQRHVEDHHHREAAQGTERRQIRAAVLAMRFRDQFLDHDVDHCASRKRKCVWQNGTHGQH
jgi:hypothetical protein